MLLSFIWWAIHGQGSSGIAADKAVFETVGEMAIRESTERGGIVQQVHHQHETGEVVRAGLIRVNIALTDDGIAAQSKPMADAAESVGKAQNQLFRAAPVNGGDVARGHQTHALHEQRLRRERPNRGGLEGLKLSEQVGHEGAAR